MAITAGGHPGTSVTGRGRGRRTRVAVAIVVSAIGLVVGAPALIAGPEDSAQSAIATEAQAPQRLDHTADVLRPGSVSSTGAATMPRVAARAAGDLTVAVVGDSMFAVGAPMTRAVIGTTPGVDLVHWKAISGLAISNHPTALSASADVVVTTFAYNDAAIHGWPGARPWLKRFLRAHADSEIVWVLFDPGTSRAMRRYYAWLTHQSHNRANLHLVQFGTLHSRRVAWICGQPCGGLGFHLQPGRGGVAVMAAMIRSQLEHLVRTRTGAG